ncbi:pyridoxal 5'-phosphate synthase glutaminase subunit PdxT [Streptococcus equinus]|uniref:pyridoxal 5'-phosphate synthase glutaminase subunit PdxT n=1 Tax=Streptococcus equinus TaxID=1335 RepID=UPI000DF8F03C|nr:pyridoxal 5'-phosphate synthase glutaminase subunit PdxT [Streptococcus equinus]SUO80193.1 glutamine amidotransferase family protein [Streptococcus equinus]
MVLIGVLALQGDFAEHKIKLASLGAETVDIRQFDDLHKPLDGIVLPGGESTVQGKLLNDLSLLEPLREKIIQGLPVLATCAGLILLSEQVENQSKMYLATLPVTVRRNAYGRQLGSFFTHLDFKNIGQVPATFIRAPYISEVRNGVEILSEHHGKIVAVRYQNQIALAYHPEVDSDNSIHSYFLKICQNKE